MPRLRSNFLEEKEESPFGAISDKSAAIARSFTRGRARAPYRFLFWPGRRNQETFLEARSTCPPAALRWLAGWLRWMAGSPTGEASHRPSPFEWKTEKPGVWLRAEGFFF